MRKRLIGVLAIPLLILIAIGIYYVPPVHEHLAWRLDDLRTRITYLIRPPSQAVFVPEVSQQVAIDAIVQATMQAYAAQTPTAIAVQISGSPTAAPTITPTPLPSSVNLPGVVYMDQSGGWNLCGPTNLYMALKFWGWTGDRDNIIKVVKPGENDPTKSFFERGFTDHNVMPYELVDFVNNDTKFHALYRYGGDINLLKSLIASGFSVLVEKQAYERSITDSPGQVSWFGHYAFVTGYDDSQGVFFYQDTYPPAGVSGQNRPISYSDFQTAWRAFDYIFIMVYPADRENDVMTLLGSYADPKWAAQNALNVDNKDVQTLTGIDLFFAWFAKGTSHVALQQYTDAASAYDQAFSIYNSLGNDNSERPYRMMWYQSGPYFAYYYSARYQDVIDLANTTLNKTIAQPTLEESLYWRGMAEQALGDTTDAIVDFKKANYLNPKMVVIIQVLQSLGIAPVKPIE